VNINPRAIVGPYDAKSMSSLAHANVEFAHAKAVETADSIQQLKQKASKFFNQPK
jgi:hypothetical protein